MARRRTRKIYTYHPSRDRRGPDPRLSVARAMAQVLGWTDLAGGAWRRTAPSSSLRCWPGGSRSQAARRRSSRYLRV